jgi:hypothetical protein
VFGIALLGAVVTSAFKRSFLAKLLAFGVPPATAHAIVDRANASGAASGSTSQLPSNVPPQAIEAIKESFTHAMHVGLLIAVGFALLASVVSILFVRSHVGGGQGGEGGH